MRKAINFDLDTKKTERSLLHYKQSVGIFESLQRNKNFHERKRIFTQAIVWLFF